MPYFVRLLALPVVYVWCFARYNTNSDHCYFNLNSIFSKRNQVNKHAFYS